MDTKIRDLVDSIKALDIKGEEVGLSRDEMKIRKDNFSQLRVLLKSKDSLVFQRSWSRWLKAGNANTRYFHVCIKARGVEIKSQP